MKLFKWKSGLKPKFPNVIEKFFGKKITDEASWDEDVSLVPSVNIADKDKTFEVNVALPGVDKKDVNIEIRDNCLVISSEKTYENEEKDENWVRREYGYASFQRMFELPESADPDKVKAKMKNGVLSITVGKKEGYETGKKKIAIQ
ncbi:MAG: Hsp20/alpha crystallin family protein [Chlorobi bacterium]|nr:Hsp20/alpha crystallin family protein [Chlorobiota bacterium]